MKKIKANSTITKKERGINMKSMELVNTVDMMTSSDYKERFKAEYYQLSIRYQKLNAMVDKWDSGQLEFTPTCPREIYDDQLRYMRGYMNILEQRAEIENVDLA